MVQDNYSGLAELNKNYKNQTFEADQHQRKCNILEGCTIKSVDFVSKELENLVMTDS